MWKHCILHTRKMFSHIILKEIACRKWTACTLLGKRISRIPVSGALRGSTLLFAWGWYQFARRYTFVGATKWRVNYILVLLKWSEKLVQRVDSQMQNQCLRAHKNMSLCWYGVWKMTRWNPNIFESWRWPKPSLVIYLGLK